MKDCLRPKNGDYRNIGALILTPMQDCVLAESEADSVQVASILKSEKLTKTLITMANLRSNKRLAERPVINFPENVTPAFDIITHNGKAPGLDGLIHLITRSKVVVNTYREAIDLRNSKYGKYITEIYTKNGEIIRKNGKITSIGEEKPSFINFDLINRIENEINKLSTYQAAI